MSGCSTFGELAAVADTAEYHEYAAASATAVA